VRHPALAYGPHDRAKVNGDAAQLDAQDAVLLTHQDKAAQLLDPEKAKRALYMAEDRKADGTVVRP
jgi:hypothetical protein